MTLNLTNDSTIHSKHSINYNNSITINARPKTINSNSLNNYEVKFNSPFCNRNRSASFNNLVKKEIRQKNNSVKNNSIDEKVSSF